MPIDSSARPCARQLAQRGEMGRLSSESVARGGIVISPATVTGQRSMNPGELARRDPALAGLTGDVTSISTRSAGPPLRPSCASAESLATDWM